MRKFVLEYLISSTILLCILIGIFNSFNVNVVDQNYLRFTTGQKQSLILGGSRTANAVHPLTLVEKGVCKEAPLNFSFTGRISPYGPVYLKSITNKLDENSTDGIFILSVNQRLIGCDTKDVNNEALFRENDECLNKVSFVNLNPNFEYLMKCSKTSLFDIVVKNEADVFLGEHGMVRFKEKPEDQKRAQTAAVLANIKKTDNRISPLRIEYLKKTVALLKQHGAVYLVRVPTQQDFIAYEEQVMPEFTAMMLDLADEMNVVYFDFTPLANQFEYRDGSHISASSATQFTSILADSILNVMAEHIN